MFRTSSIALLALAILLLIATSQLVSRISAQAVAPTASLVRWEYKIHETGISTSSFNSLGDEGWELVSISEHKPATGYLAVFKRPRR